MIKYKLNELYSITSGLSKPANQFGYGNPFLSFSTVFNNFHIPNEITELVNTNSSEINRFSIQRGDIFITRTSEKLDELGKSCVALKDIPNATFNGFCKRLRPKFNENIILPEYAQYLFRSKQFTNQIIYSCPMSTRASLNEEILNTIVLNVHSLNEQQHIVDTVGSLDDKIENNNKIIEKLIKWKANNYQKILNETSCCETDLLNIVNFIGGTQPPKSEHIYNYEKGYVRFIQNRDYSSENHLTFIKISSKNKLCNEYDIMMDKYGEAGKVRFGINGAYNVALAKIEPKKENYQEWIREFLNTNKIQQYLYNSSIASTRASVSENNLMNIKISLPNENVVYNFEKRHKTILKMILNLKMENKYLQDLKELYLDYYFN